MKQGKKLIVQIVPLLTSWLADRTGKNGGQRKDLCSDSLKSMGLPIFYEPQEERNTLESPATQACT